MARASSQPIPGAKEFGLVSFLQRLIASSVLVLATYNPSGFSYFHWLKGAHERHALGPEHFLAGTCIAAGWAVLFVATQRSLGALGLVLVAALLGGVVWYLINLGVLTLSSASALTWVSLACLAVLLAVGLSWSHIWRRMTGQLEVDDRD